MTLNLAYSKNNPEKPQTLKVTLTKLPLNPQTLEIALNFPNQTTQENLNPKTTLNLPNSKNTPRKPQILKVTLNQNNFKIT
jgi:hypothetical protein